MIKKVKARGKTRYKVAYRTPDSRNTKAKTFDTLDAAKAFEADLARAKAGIIEFPAARITQMTLEQFGLEYRSKYMAVELAPSTQASYRITWNNHIRKRIGHLPLSSITRETVQQLKADLMADGVGDATVVRALTVLGAVLNRAVEWGKLPYNPATGVRKPPKKRSRKIEPMGLDWVAELISGLPSERDKLLVALLGYAGLRPGEALALTGPDMRGGVINVDKAIALGTEKDTKTRVDRIVPILPELAPFVGDLPAGLLFPRADGNPWLDHDYRNWRKRVFKPAVRTLGVDPDLIAQAKAEQTELPAGEWAEFRPYDLRHGFASRLLMDPRWTQIEVAEVMGHSTTILLSTYAHVITSMRWAHLNQAQKAA